MDKIAEKLAGWFGSVPFIAVHIVWFGIWLVLHFTAGFDEDWSMLTLIVSLEAIFLSLFILRAENVQSKRQEEKIKTDIKNTKHDIEMTKKIISKLNKK